MQVLQTTLLTGPYDWDAALMPRTEFAARLAAVRVTMAETGVEALLVYGNSREYGALNYVTGFTPKLDHALALVPAAGPLRLLVSGTDLMLPAAKLQTWVEDVGTLANIGKLLPEWLAERGFARAITLGTWGGAGMPRILYTGVVNGMRERGRILDCDAALDLLRRRKTPRERDLIRRACHVLGTAADAFAEAARNGAGNRAAALAAERAAFDAGAQDARVLASLRAGGPPLPLDGARDVAVDPLLAAIAVQHTGYWAEGLLTLAATPRQAPARATAALEAVLRQAKAAVAASTLARAAATTIAPATPHPLTGGAIGYGIGLSLEEAPLAGDAPLEAGAVYCLRVGAEAAPGDAAIASAMVAVDTNASEILWRSPK